MKTSKGCPRFEENDPSAAQQPSARVTVKVQTNAYQCVRMAKVQTWFKLQAGSHGRILRWLYDTR